MGRIFKTPTDDSTEATLRAMHIANTVDTAYERAWGWLKALVFSVASALTVSAVEFHSDWSLWDTTAQWFGEKLSGWLGGWFD